MSRLRNAFTCALVLAMSQTIAICHAADEKALLEWGNTYTQDVWPFVKEKCLNCHSGAEPDGGFDVAKFEKSDEVVKAQGVWESVAKRVRLKEMPPEGSPQLSDPEKSKFHRWLDSRPSDDLCSQIANDETQAWYRGFVMSRRLTRTEYLNAIRDAVGIEVDASLPVPSDGSGGEGFDTNGDTLFTSPIHIEQYLNVARLTIARAIPNALVDLRAEQWTGEREIATKLLGADWPGSHASHDQVKAVIARFATRAWRRPVMPDEVDRLAQLYVAARDRQEAIGPAIRQSLVGVLLSPHFLFVVETESEEGGVQRLTSHQLAFRLSLLIWSSIPDETLMTSADRDELQTPEQILGQVHRMLDDPRSRAIGENFGLQWLGLTHFLSTAKPDAELYPEYDRELAESMREEAIRTIADVFQNNRPLTDLINSDHVIVNRRLAKLYGMPEVAPEKADSTDTWQRIAVTDRNRGGIVTLGATLVSTSYPRRTSPVLRGRWILEDVLGSKVPPPPPNVPALEEHVADKPMSLRERLELHRKNAECASCHNRMDPLGFGLENFDVLARWRSEDQGVAIDASGVLPSGEKFAGPIELKQTIMKRAGEFERHFVRKLLGFALGRELNKFDDCVIDECVKKLASNEHRSRVIIETIATSYPFQHRYFTATKGK